MEENENKVSWNLSEHLIKEIASLLAQSSSYFIGRQYDRCFDCLVAAKLRAIQSFNEKERNVFETAEKKILHYINAIGSRELRHNNFDLWIKTNNLTYDGICNYNVMLMDALNRYGYLIKLQEDTTRLQA